MKPHIVLRFSSSNEEDEYSNSSEINIKPQIQQKTNSRIQKSELIEVSSESDGYTAIPIISSAKKAQNKSSNMNDAHKLPSRFLSTSKNVNQKAKQLSNILKNCSDNRNTEDYSTEYEYEYEENPININSNDNMENSNDKTNSLTLVQTDPDNPVNDFCSYISLSSSQEIHSEYIASQSNEVSNLNSYDYYNNIDSENHIRNTINYSQLNNQDVYPIYRCHRTSSKIAGRSVNFALYRSDIQIMAAVGKGFNHDKVEIFLDDVSVLKIQKKRLKSNEVVFNLLKEPEDQLEAKIIFTHKENSQPRKISITINNPSLGLPSKIESMKPKYNEAKKLWQMNFKGKFVLRSIKNTILVDEQLNKLMYVRKTTKDDLIIDILSQINEVFIFSFAISSFLCKI